MKTVLITGGAGFLGVYLSRFLLKKGFKIICLDIAPFTARDIEKKITYVKADIRNAKLMEKELKSVDYVVHAAAALPIIHDRSEIFKTNVDGTRNILKAALKNKIKKLVFISSTATYGVPKHLPETETDDIAPIGHYGESKVKGEELCFEFLGKGLPINIIRPKTFLGPERLGVFTLWFEAVYKNKPVFILGNGNNLYQLLEVNDLCDMIYNALITKKSGEIFNAGAAKFGTWRKDLGALIKHAKSKSKIVGFPVLPSQLALGFLEALNLSPIVAWHYKTLPVNSYVSIEKAKKELGFKPKKSNQDILIESYDWYAKNRDQFIGKVGTGHRVVWDFKLLSIFDKLS
ncbi:MAG TPA: NAD(P)-dependent oxidoreductase [Patescibacteria group bacterium]|nr:NAD(P)-dependent oxidoreductase [Patescibacteria group bacterium]